MFDIKAFLQSYISALCGSAVQWPQREQGKLFLYGTPSESGNIGLRVGDNVTYYKGVVAPPLPEWDEDEYPYVYIAYREPPADFYLIYASTRRLSVQNDGNTTYNTVTSFPMLASAGYCLGDDSWGGLIQTSLASGYPPIWANYDMKRYLKTSEIVLPATDPIPVSGEIVDYINEIPIYEVI